MEICHSEESINIIILELLCKYDLKSVTISSRISKSFELKLYRMCKKLSTAAGAKNLALIEKKWKAGKLSTWKFKIYYSELESYELKEENARIKLMKRKAEQELDEEKTKKARIEIKFDKAMNDLDQQKEKLIKLKQKFLSSVHNFAKGTKARGPSKAKRFLEYSQKHQNRIRKQFVQDSQTVLSFLEMYGFHASKVEIYNADT